MSKLRLIAVVGGCVLACAGLAVGQVVPTAGGGPAVVYELPEFGAQATAPGGSTAYPKGDFYQQLSAATGDAPNSCEYHWGAGGSPFRTGPGRCDTWRVGPVWRGDINGLVLFRENTDLLGLAASADAGGVAFPINGRTLQSNFEHGAGVRASLAGQWPQCRGYELQLQYTGVFEWERGAVQPRRAAARPHRPGRPGAAAVAPYRSTLHTLEMNIRPARDSYLQPYYGFRYLLLAEDLDDSATETAPIPFPPVADIILSDVTRSTDIDNNLVGFQLGLHADKVPVSEKARAIGYRGQRFFTMAINHWYNPGGDAPPPVADLGDVEDVDFLVQRGEEVRAYLNEDEIRTGTQGTGIYNPNHAYGTEADAIEYVERLVDAGADEIMFLIQMGTVPQDAALETITRLGKDVIPRFR